MIFLQGHGVSTTYAVKIYKQYEDDAIQIVTENPYRLSSDVYGIGFVIADEIARSLGVHPNSEFRYRAGTLHVLSEASTDGHCFLPQSELIGRTVKRLALPGHRIHPADIETLTTTMSIVLSGQLHHGKAVLVFFRFKILHEARQDSALGQTSAAIFEE